MENKSTEKHFLDTSVVRSVLCASSTYKEYFRSQFGEDRVYISRYVQMEFRRSFLLNAIAFYSLLDLPTTQTIGDAYAIWSDKFKGSQLKAILQITAELFSTHRLSTSLPQDKPKALAVLWKLIKRYEMRLSHQFRDTGVDSTRCARALIRLKAGPKNVTRDLRRFVGAFSDKATCRSKCRVDTFLLGTHREKVEHYVQLKGALRKNKDTTGFINIAGNLGEILEKGGAACSCDRCEKIGDAVIALDAPRNMRLEHTDASFNHLCPPLNQPHHQHPSQAAVIKDTPAKKAAPK